MQGGIPSPMSDAQVAEVARLFGILSEPSRLQLLRALMDGEQTVTDLIEITGMKQGNVSKHLGVLLAGRLVERRKDGNFARFRVRDPLVQDLCHLVCERLERDAAEQFAALRGPKG